MNLEDIVEGMGGPWKPEPPPELSYLPDFRYSGTRSCFDVDGDIVAELRKQWDEVEATKKKPGTPIAWDRLMWDEPWEPPKAKPPSARPPILVAHVFDALAGYGRDPMPAHGWLLPMGMAINRLCQDIVKGRSSSDSDFELLKLQKEYEDFSESAAMSRFNPSFKDASSLITYAMDVETVTRAAMDLKGLWFNFLDVAVLTAQQGMRLKTPPVFIVLFLNFEFAPGAQDAIVRSLRKMAHPRLLCLFGKEPD